METSCSGSMALRSPTLAQPFPCSRTFKVVHKCESMSCATASRLPFRMRFANKLPNKAKRQRGGLSSAPFWLGLVLLLCTSVGWAQDHDEFSDRVGDGHSFSDEDLGPVANRKKSFPE